MTTTGCPFCGELIHLHARRCNHCAELIGSPTRESVFDDQVDVEKILAADADAFTLAYLRGAELRGAYLSGADLFGADLASADLRGADLGGANLSTANLRGADLSGANLHEADVSDADLSGADLSRANLTGADLRGALYDAVTAWPDDFDPESAGAIHQTHWK